MNATDVLVTMLQGFAVWLALVGVAGIAVTLGFAWSRNKHRYDNPYDHTGEGPDGFA